VEISDFISVMHQCNSRQQLQSLKNTEHTSAFFTSLHVEVHVCFWMKWIHYSAHLEVLHNVACDVVYFCCTMLCKHGLCCQAVSMCPSRSWILSKQVNVSSKLFYHWVPTPF